MREYFRTEQITDTITRIWLPGGVFGYIAAGNKCAAVIDTGCGVGPYRTFVEEFLDGMPYEVILTHGHLDHAGGASEFDQVWLNEKDFPLAAKHTQKEARYGYVMGNEPDSDYTLTDLVEPKVDGYSPLVYGQTFDLGGVTLEIVNIGGHTKGSIGILFREEQILLAGDACCSFTLLFGAPNSLSVSDYQASLKQLLADHEGRFTTMLYSHPHNVGGPEVISDMISLCSDVLAGKDDKLPMEMHGSKACLARATGPDMKPLCGGLANLAYAVE